RHRRRSRSACGTGAWRARGPNPAISWYAAAGGRGEGLIAARQTGAMALTTRMLNPETWDGFATLVGGNNGGWGGWWCMGVHPEGVGKGHTVEGNRDAKRRHVGRGTVHQVLVYDGDRCVGWCQFGAPAEIPNIKNRRAYEKEAQDPPDWRIGCVFTN